MSLCLSYTPTSPLLSPLQLSIFFTTSSRLLFLSLISLFFIPFSFISFLSFNVETLPSATLLSTSIILFLFILPFLVITTSSFLSSPLAFSLVETIRPLRLKSSLKPEIRRYFPGFVSIGFS